MTLSDRLDPARLADLVQDRLFATVGDAVWIGAMPRQATDEQAAAMAALRAAQAAHPGLHAAREQREHVTPGTIYVRFKSGVLGAEVRVGVAPETCKLTEVWLFGCDLGQHLVQGTADILEREAADALKAEAAQEVDSMWAPS